MDLNHNTSFRPWSFAKMPIKMVDVLKLFILLLSVTSGQNVAEQIHLSFGDTHDTMAVMWATHINIQGFVNYGKSKETMNMRSKSRMSVLENDNWNSLKFIHRAEMKGLEPGTTYHYQVYANSPTSPDTGSTIYSFRTPELNQNKTSVLVYGDMGALQGQNTFPVLAEEVQSGIYDAVWHVGDIAYDLNNEGGKYGDEFLRRLEPVAARIPYMTLPGNHEPFKEYHHYRTRFSMPDSGGWPMKKEKLWYSYNLGPVHFLTYSTEVYFNDNQNQVCQQYNWLLQDLIEANKNRHVRPWIIAMGHRPMYCSTKNLDDCTGRILGYIVKNGLEDLFYAQGVDLVIEGHEHLYERLWPVYDEDVRAESYVNPSAPVHIISGAAGCKEGEERFQKPGVWSAFRVDKGSFHSYGRLFIHNNTHLYFEQVDASPKKLLDSFWMIQNNHGPNVKNINCDDYREKHHTCSCPRPFHYMTYLAVISVVLFVVIVVSVTLYCWCCCRKKCCSKAKQNSRQSMYGDLHDINMDASDRMLLMSDYDGNDNI